MATQTFDLTEPADNFQGYKLTEISATEFAHVREYFEPIIPHGIMNEAQAFLDQNPDGNVEFILSSEEAGCLIFDINHALKTADNENLDTNIQCILCQYLVDLGSQGLIVDPETT